MSLDFLLEIGTEEIPHWMIPGALKQLAAADLLGAKSRVDATPRRLVVQASGLPERTPDQHQVIKGPPVSAGEKAAAGFAKKQGVDLQAMQKAGDYYELRKLVPGRRAIDILAEALPGVILGIQWPKTMYWTAKETVLLGPAPGPGTSYGQPMDQATEESIKRIKPQGGGVYIQETKPGQRVWAAEKLVRFIRPIRWIVALLGDEVIPFEIAGVKSGNITRGHRQLGSPSIPVTIASYEKELRSNFVILAAHERRHKIEKEASALGAKIDTDLLETLTYITEYPTAIRGEFDPAYLELPAEVLTTVMRHHQKYFSVESATGVLAPYFVAVMNTSGDPEGLVKHGNERVLKERFNDARFFWNVDQSKTLEARVPDLAHVTFQAKLGSYLGKTGRMVDLVKELGGDEHAQRAARLSKCDLTTEMVKEFTDLQGIVGGLYARAQGEPEPVCLAIYEHYKPLSMDDEIPRTREGQIVALADKLDTLRECFRIGMVPTGSKDPFALRRAAQGVVKILAEGESSYFLGRLQTILAAAYPFVLDRIRHYFQEVRKFRYDEVNAVLTPLRLTSLKDVEARLVALSQVRPTVDFEPVAASAKRIRNILEQAKFRPTGSVDISLLEAGPELDLYNDLGRVSDAAAIRTTEDYRNALAAMASMRPRIDAFFDKVLVNAQDEGLRANRLMLLHSLLAKFSNIADFSEIVTSGETK